MRIDSGKVETEADKERRKDRFRSLWVFWNDASIARSEIEGIANCS